MMLLRPVLVLNRLTLAFPRSGKITALKLVRSYQNDRSKRPNFRSRDNYGRDRRDIREGKDDDDVSFSKATFSKLIHVPKDEATAEVTLDQLLEDGLVDKTLHKSIARMGFPNLTSVQQKTIKPIVESKEQDVIARAKTGTGKTFAFLIPIFQHLINTRTESQYMVKCVIVAPTRDLALQIEAEIHKIHENNYGLKKFGCISLVGGTNFGSSMRRMSSLRPNIVIGTPGRLIAVLDQCADKYFKYVDFKILDEADRLLEIGFKEDLEHISNTLNKKNAISADHIRTLLFSATLDEKVQTLANKIMNKNECLFLDTVDKNEPEAHERIDQSMVISERFAHSIYAAVEHIKSKIETEPNYKAILFTPTVKFTKFLSAILRRELHRKLPVLEFHGQIDQRRRTNLVKQFKKDVSGLLICTDVGARGMDFPNVQEVLQIGVPSELANYIHRIGRTARGGQEGASRIFLCKDELSFVDELSNRKNVKIAKEEEYVPSETIAEEFALKIEDPEDFADVLTSLISFYKSSIKEYAFNERSLLPEVATAYGLLLNDEERKIPINSRNMLERLGFSRSPLASKMFDLQGDAVQEGRNNNWDQRRPQYNRRGSNNSNSSYQRRSSFSAESGNNRRYNPNYERKFMGRKQGENPHFDN